uniref:Succinyl-CoA:3-ketoacid-coenzyme A transferase subunit B n=1 Tax=Anthurium amnicola TaxID=1678845 RepID=A0A1D1XG56_9ARAE
MLNANSLRTTKLQVISMRVPCEQLWRFEVDIFRSCRCQCLACIPSGALMRGDGCGVVIMGLVGISQDGGVALRKIWRGGGRGLDVSSSGGPVVLVLKYCYKAFFVE